MSQISKVYITGSGLFTPPYSISNDELVDSFNTYVQLENAKNKEKIDSGQFEPLEQSSSAFIQKASGVKSRFVMNKEGILNTDRMKPHIPERENDELSIQCEMAKDAALEALKNSQNEAQDIELLIMACSNFQRAYPAMSVELQKALGTQGYAYDMNVACSSATFGMETAANAIRSGQVKKALVVNPEICTAHLNFKDRDSHFIFGDAATAVVLESEESFKKNPNREAFELLSSKCQTQFSSNIRNNYGFLNNADEEGIGQPDKLFKQQGRKVFKEVVPMVAKLISHHLDESNTQVDKVKRFWLHQANLSMNLLISKKILGRDPKELEVPNTLGEYANTSSAGSIIAFHKHREGMSSGDYGVICSFGAGYSVGSLLIQKV